jgi:hypothetical protein
MRRLLILAIVLGGCPASSPTNAPRAESAKTTPNFSEAFKHQVQLEHGELIVHFTIAPSFHAYAEGETVGRPIELEIDQDSQLVGAAPITYPKGEPKELPIGHSVILTGAGEIRLAVKAADGGALTGKTAKGALHYQICTDTACDRPHAVRFEVGL